ncbi:MAG: Rid family detoxifying hydrolase [Acidobacteriota bacterium]|nr:Rid family detoxifying hydrolase [Acidobacteriota bacterium]
MMIFRNRTDVAALITLAGLIVVIPMIVASDGKASTRQVMEERQVIRPETYPYFGLPYSPGILTGDTLYIAGHLGRDPVTTNLVSGGIKPETRQSLANIREVLLTAGMDFENVVSVTAYIVDISEFATFNEVYREYFPENPPARATVQVAALNVGAKVELQMIAVR